MKEINKRAFNEMIEILKYSKEEVTNKIPEKFRIFLEANKEDTYEANINFNIKNWEETLLDDTKVLMGLVYRDYIVSEEERKKLLLEEENDYQEKYSYDNIFKKKSEENNNLNNMINLQLVEIKESGWLKKLINKIFKIFKK